MIRDLFEGWHLVIVLVVVLLLFGYKRMPDAARSLGRSMRIFKSEVDTMRKDDKKPESEAGGAGTPSEPLTGRIVEQPPAPGASSSQSTHATPEASGDDRR